MTFSRTVIPFTRLKCWKMNPNVARRISVRNRSGRLVISSSRISSPPGKPAIPLPLSTIRPDVGRAMQPISVRSVVFPEPLGPFRTVNRAGAIVRPTFRTAMNSIRLAEVESISSRRGA